MRSLTRCDERGAAAVELAIVLPVLLLLIGGIVDFGRFFFLQIQLTNAAREGARAAIVSTGAPVPGPAERAMAALPGLSSPPIQVAVNGCGGAALNASVTITDPTYKWLLLGPALNMVGSGDFLPKNINATAVMKCGG